MKTFLYLRASTSEQTLDYRIKQAGQAIAMKEAQVDGITNAKKDKSL